MSKNLLFYRTKLGNVPFVRWLKKLKDIKAKAIINSRLHRVIADDLGDFKRLSDRVFELRIAFGPGYRIYIAWVTERCYLLLLGGSKATQKADIEKAMRYWSRYKARYDYAQEKTETEEAY